MFICACVYLYLCLSVFVQHDVTVAAFLSVLGVFNNILPPYMSSVLVELFNTSGQLFVKVWYRNDSAATAEPFQMTVPGNALCISASNL